MAFFSFSKTTKGVLEKQSSGRKIQRQRRGKVSRANGLSTEPPRAGSPGPALLLGNSCKLKTPRLPRDRDPGRPGPQGPRLLLDGQAAAASCSEGLAAPGMAGGGQAKLAAGRPRGREQSCQAPSCCLASFSRSFNVHSSRISESSQHQLSSDLFLHGGCYDHRGHLTSGSRPGFFWQSWMVGTRFHLNGDSAGSSGPLPHPAF